ncbi:MAG: 6-phosphogluconolactonase, partial [Planktomarina sp.]
MNLIEYTDKQTMMIAVADMVAANIEAALDVRNKASIAVPGGTTPGPMFDELCQAKLNWKDVSVMLTDERWVAEDDPRSNTMLVKNRLICNQSVDISYVGLYNGDNSPLLGATSVSQDVEAQLPLDVVVLGMGADMHTASLFPGAAELPMAQASDAPAVVAITPGGD